MPIVRKNRRITRRAHFLFGMGLVSIALVSATIWTLTTDTPASGSDAQTRETIQKVGRLVVLPTDEEPAIATVSDDMRASDKFLEQAQNGDKLLLYYQSLKAYIYRPSQDKVVDIGPITIDPAVDEVMGARIVLVDGASQAEKLADYHTRLSSIYKGATIAQAPHAATRNNYPRTIVVDLTDDSQKYNLTNNIAATLGARRGVLPLGEVMPDNADILIIVGKE